MSVGASQPSDVNGRRVVGIPTENTLTTTMIINILRPMIYVITLDNDY